MGTEKSFELAVHRHDQRIAELGLDIWVGSEPTFTDREAQTPPWLNTALGSDKEARAQALLRHLSSLMKGGLLLRSVGRQYPGEKTPRWNLGLLRHRNGSALWGGPTDPVLLNAAVLTSQPDIAALARALSEALEYQGWPAECAQLDGPEHQTAWQVTARIGLGKIDSLIFQIHVLVLGVGQVSDPAPVVKELLQAPGLHIFDIPFRPFFEQTLMALVLGLKVVDPANV